ncbi:MAG: GNAT family N-acetyltransferase [Candidatus Nanoarchaeia archaeon]|jgi:ribosomal protein S18 acetylase RimI-like enzyme
MIRQVTKSDEEKLRIIAKQYLVHLYGSQESNVTEWITGKAYKKSLVFDEDNSIAGLLVLKDNPKKDYVKISTLIVLDGYRNKDIGNSLLEQALIYTEKVKKNNISTTVSEDIVDGLAFFIKKGFRIIKEMKDKYKKGKIEYILLKRLD